MNNFHILIQASLFFCSSSILFCPCLLVHARQMFSPNTFIKFTWPAYRCNRLGTTHDLCWMALDKWVLALSEARITQILDEKSFYISLNSHNVSNCRCIISPWHHHHHHSSFPTLSWLAT